MFTGLIEETGKIRNISAIAGGKKLVIQANLILNDLKRDDSIAINGVCLTAIAHSKTDFTVEAVAETLEKTTIGFLKEGTIVNLERAVRLNDRMGGHLVQGHVNGMAKISRIEKLGENFALDVLVPDEIEHYLILEGSIALNGISLTIARLNENTVGINIIPHTWASTNLITLNIGDYINVEVDVIAKYVEKFFTRKSKNENSKITFKKLNELGF